MYIKKYDENGLVTNPITKENPYLTHGNRSQRRQKQRKSNNRAGHGLVVAGSVKYRIVKQHTPVYKTIMLDTVIGKQPKRIKTGNRLIINSVLV